MKNIILICFMFLAVNCFTEDMYAIHANCVSNEAIIQGIVDDLLPDATNFIWVTGQEYQYNTNASSGTPYITVMIRYGKENLANNRASKLAKKWDDYEPLIVSGYIKTHTCYNDGGGIPCKETTLRSK